MPKARKIFYYIEDAQCVLWWFDDEDRIEDGRITSITSFVGRMAIANVYKVPVIQVQE